MADAALIRFLGGSRPAAAADWDALIPQARAAGLLGRLAFNLERQGGLDVVPPQMRRHLVGAQLVAQRQAEAVHWEVSQIKEALDSVGVTTLLLKGAAYVMADLPPAKGRLMSDIDILVPRDALGPVESALMIAGWATTHHDPYDQQYYRRWMHELPPMRHVVRGSVVDVHHALLPVTARIRVDTEAMRAAAVPVQRHPQLRVLPPADMVLHAATHLFCESEWYSGLRDLSDLDLLLRHFSGCAGFWDELVARADTVGLRRPLYYALTLSAAILGTPVPSATLSSTSEFGPAEPLRTLMGALFRRVLAGQLPNEQDPVAALARSALFLRGHWLRMPTHLLVFHLGHKVMAGANRRAKSAADQSTN